MTIVEIAAKLKDRGILHTQGNIQERPSAVGYEKEFRWSWLGTQLNTFVVATDFSGSTINVPSIESHMTASFNYADRNYTGWPRGLQSAVAVISVLVGTDIDEAAIDYCLQLKSGKKWAGFTIPVIVNSTTGEVHAFKKNPLWGRIYFPHFKKMINDICSN